MTSKQLSMRVSRYLEYRAPRSYQGIHTLMLLATEHEHYLGYKIFGLQYTARRGHIGEYPRLLCKLEYIPSAGHTENTQSYDNSRGFNIPPQTSHCRVAHHCRHLPRRPVSVRLTPRETRNKIFLPSILLGMSWGRVLPSQPGRAHLYYNIIVANSWHH